MAKQKKIKENGQTYKMEQNNLVPILALSRRVKNNANLYHNSKVAVNLRVYYPLKLAMFSSLNQTSLGDT